MRRIHPRRVSLAAWIWIAPVLAILCAVSPTVSAVEPIDADGLDRYRAAVAELDARQAAEAERALQQIVEQFPHPNLAGDYRPYYQIARAQLMLGDLAGAELSLAISEGLLPHKPKRKILQSVERLRGSLEKATYGASD